jgi:hypothetical protein
MGCRQKDWEMPLGTFNNCLGRSFDMSGGNEAAATSVTERAPCQGFLQKHGGFIFKKVAGT